MTFLSPELLLATLAAGFAGVVDAIAGGGGLVMVSALFVAYPTAPAADLFATNKSASFWGTLFAAWRYSRRVSIDKHLVAAGVGAGIVGGGLGAFALLFIPTDLLRSLLPFALAAVLVYTLFNHHLGRVQQRRFKPRQERQITALITFLLGFYDGFFGPGMGSFLIFAMIRVLGFDFLHASAYAKIFNAATNLVALTLLASSGKVWWHITPFLLIANLLGSFIGAHLALKHGSGFIRAVFVVVVFALIVKAAVDSFF